MTCRPTTSGTGRWTCETCGADLGTSEGKAPPDFARCPERGATPMQAFARRVLAHAAARATQPPDVAWDWVRSVESLDADDAPAPVPVDELSVMIREDGELAETPALALLDEIQRLRTALAARDAWGVLGGDGPMHLARIPVPDLCDRLRTSTPLPGLDWPATKRAIVRELCRRAGEGEPDWSEAFLDD